MSCTLGLRCWLVCVRLHGCMHACMECATCAAYMVCQVCLPCSCAANYELLATVCSYCARTAVLLCVLHCCACWCASMSQCVLVKSIPACRRRSRTLPIGTRMSAELNDFAHRHLHVGREAAYDGSSSPSPTALPPRLEDLLHWQRLSTPLKLRRRLGRCLRWRRRDQATASKPDGRGTVHAKKAGTDAPKIVRQRGQIVNRDSNSARIPQQYPSEPDALRVCAAMHAACSRVCVRVRVRACVHVCS